MRFWSVVVLAGAPALIAACALLPLADHEASRPFEANITYPAAFPRIGDRIDVAYRYLGKDRQHLILFGGDKALTAEMLYLGEATSDPGTFSFVLEPRMVDRRDASRSLDVIPERIYSIGFAGFKDGVEFGALICQTRVQASPATSSI